MANKTLGEFSDGEDEWLFEIDESVFIPQPVPINTLGESSSRKSRPQKNGGISSLEIRNVTSRTDQL